MVYRQKQCAGFSVGSRWGRTLPLLLLFTLHMQGGVLQQTSPISVSIPSSSLTRASPGQLAIPCAMFPKEQGGGERSRGLLDLELRVPRCGRCSSHLSGHLSGPFLGFSIPGGKPVGWGQGEVNRPTLLSLCPALPPPTSGSGDQASPALL